MRHWKIASATAVIALAGSVVEAQQFRPLSLEMGPAPSVRGTGFMTSSGGFYNRQGDTTTTALPSSAQLWSESVNNHVAYDSYLTMSGRGPSRLSEADDVGESLSPQLRAFYGYADSASSAIPSPFYFQAHIGDSSSLTGQPPYAATTPVNRARGGINAPPVNGEFLRSGINPINGRDAVFIAQFTVNRGSTLSGSIILSNFLAAGTFVDIPLTLNGPEVIGEATPGVFRPFVLRSYLVATNDDLSHSRSGGNAGTGVGNSQRFGAADVYHLWIEIVPAPGAAAAFGLAGLVAIRRRRA